VEAIEWPDLKPHVLAAIMDSLYRPGAQSCGGGPKSSGEDGTPV